MDTPKLKKKSEQNLSIKEIKNAIYSIVLKLIIIVHTNEKGKEPYFNYDNIYCGQKNNKMSYEQIIKIIEYCQKNKVENSDYVIEIFNFLQKIEERIKKDFNLDYCLNIKMEFKKENLNDNVVILFYSPYNNKPHKMNNIHINEINSISKGLDLLISNINNESYKDINYIYLKNLSSLTLSDIQNESTRSNTYKKANNETNYNYKIINFISKCKDAEYGKELKNVIRDNINHIKYLTESRKEKYIEAKADIEKYGYAKIKIYSFNEIIEIIVKNIILVKEDNFIIFYDKSIFIFNNLFSKLFQQVITRIYDKSYIGGIKISEYLFALTSNKMLKNGEDKLLMYDSRINIINNNTYNIKGYSFTLSQNNSSLINIPKCLKNIKIILFACKKYIKCQRNGILLTVINLDENNVYKHFYKTGNFEVYCFCPIIIKENEYILKPEQDIIINTEFCVVGGFHVKKKKGLIKLYKINIKENINDIKIEYIKDIIIEKNNNFKGFNGPITNIIQSKISGNILITDFGKKAPKRERSEQKTPINEFGKKEPKIEKSEQKTSKVEDTVYVFEFTKNILKYKNNFNYL